MTKPVKNKGVTTVGDFHAISTLYGHGNLDPETGAINDAKVMELPVWFLEFSVKQNCFHLDHLLNIYRMNIDMCSRGVQGEYVIIAGPMFHDDAFNAIKVFSYLVKNKG